MTAYEVLEWRILLCVRVLGEKERKVAGTCLKADREDTVHCLDMNHLQCKVNKDMDLSS